MSPLPHIFALTLCAVAVMLAMLSLVSHAAAQDAKKTPPKITLLGAPAGDKAAPDAPDGMACTVDELKVYKLATELRAMAAAREGAEQLLERNPDSFVAQHTLGLIHHYGEGNLPRSIYYLKESIDTLHKVHGKRPKKRVKLWEARTLVELGRSQTQIGDFEDAIETYKLHDKRFPNELPEKISTVWPLMQMRKFDRALRVAHEVLKDPRTATSDRAVALNGYAAVLFEKGEREEAHTWTTQLTTEYPNSPTFWANASESARGLLNLDESERFALESAKRGISDYAQPWIDVADIRIRRGKLKEAYLALLKDRSYRQERPPYLEQQGAASAQRTVAMLMLIAGDYEGAQNITYRAIVQPDRSGGKSRDIRQDLASSALLDFRLRHDRAQQLRDYADILGGLRLSTRAQAWKLGAEASTSAARSQSILHDNELLIGMLRIGGPYGVVLPPWMVPELIHVVGPGVFHNAVRRARELETFKPLAPYFDAFAADAALALGDTGDARKFARRARKRLPKDERLLKVRMDAILAKIELEQGNITKAIPRLDRVLAEDPGLLRRLDIQLPLKAPKGKKASAIYTALLNTNRYQARAVGYAPSVKGKRTCLLSPTGDKTKCVTASARKKGETREDAFVARTIQFHDQVFKPDVDLNTMALRALDGSNVTPSGGNRGLRELLE